MVSTEPRSLAATKSMSAPEAFTARKKLRPMRPKPLMPTRIVIWSDPLEVVVGHAPRAPLGCPSDRSRGRRADPPSAAPDEADQGGGEALRIVDRGVVGSDRVDDHVGGRGR